MLPRPLAQAQHVDYTSADKAAAFGLASSVSAMPAETPLPEPLPSEPELPTAPLHEAKQQVDSPQVLTRAEQLDLLDRLRRASDIDEQREDAGELLSEFRKRPDILGDIRDQIDAVLARVGQRNSVDISARDRGPGTVPGAETFKVSCWPVASNPRESRRWSKIQENLRAKNGTLVVEPGRLQFYRRKDRLEITAVTRVSLEPAKPGDVKSVVVEHGAGQLVAFHNLGRTNFASLFGGNRKLVQAIQRAFGLS